MLSMLLVRFLADRLSRCQWVLVQTPIHRIAEEAQLKQPALSFHHLERLGMSLIAAG